MPLSVGELHWSPSNAMWPRREAYAAYLHAKFHLDPSNCLATIHTNVTDRTDVVCPVGNFVLDGDQAPQNKGPCLLRPNGWIDKDATWYGGKPRQNRPGDVVLDAVAAPLA